ncbi:hypothetical protein [Pseudoduganella namucuonensis]|uniref:Uncharacterized protein n=1 Tax=Pseudoduganella namucuonensis TaxID=1035707 RepID=A0A1I7IZB1_9BURK|nr:hypothetical protein [Pseudoduganella namucuonensis]SFU78289.1 hypothetical protein SAMN05216552_1009185 [Pseudoduganella namucuonensis]
MEDDWKIFAARIDAILPTLATKGDLEALRADVARWTVATVIGLFIGFAGLFVAMGNILRPVSPPAAQPQQPIIIYLPAPPPQQPQQPQQK